jgi:hypothetical protein
MALNRSEGTLFWLLISKLGNEVQAMLDKPGGHPNGNSDLIFL